MRFCPIWISNVMQRIFIGSGRASIENGTLASVKLCKCGGGRMNGVEARLGPGSTRYGAMPRIKVSLAPPTAHPCSICLVRQLFRSDNLLPAQLLNPPRIFLLVYPRSSCLRQQSTPLFLNPTLPTPKPLQNNTSSSFPIVFRLPSQGMLRVNTTSKCPRVASFLPFPERKSR